MKRLGAADAALRHNPDQFSGRLVKFWAKGKDQAVLEMPVLVAY